MCSNGGHYDIYFSLDILRKCSTSKRGVVNHDGHFIVWTLLVSSYNSLNDKLPIDNGKFCWYTVDINFNMHASGQGIVKVSECLIYAISIADKSTAYTQCNVVHK